MPICAVVTCRNKSGIFNLIRGGVSYHRFPRNPDTKEKWILATGRPQDWIPSKIATICSDHFEPQHFVLKTGERRYLHSFAVPSRNINILEDEKNYKYVQATQSQHHIQRSLPGENPSTAAELAAHGEISPLLHTALSQGTNPSSSNAVISPLESIKGVKSLEVEIMPENRITLRPIDIRSLLKSDLNMNSETGEEDINLIELLRIKIREQDLLISKLKMRNNRLKKRLFSLKSMEVIES